MLEEKQVKQQKLKKDLLIVLIVVAVVALVVALILYRQKLEDDEASTPKSTAVNVDYDADDYVTLGDYTGFTAYYVKPTVTDEQIQAKVDTLLEQGIEYGEVTNRGVISGDRITVDFVGTIDGEEFDGGTATDYTYVTGAGQMIDGFDEGLVDVKTGEKKTLNLVFPDDYSKTDVAGKNVDFEVTVNKIEEITNTPTWTDEYADKISNGDYKTTSEYEASIREDLLSAAESTNESSIRNQLWIKVNDAATIDGYPQELYDQMQQSVTATATQSAAQWGMEVDDYLKAFYNETLEQYIMSYVQTDMLSKALEKKLGLEITKEEYLAGVKQLAEDQGITEDTLEENYAKEDIEEYLISEKMFKYLEDNNEVKEVSQEEYDEITAAAEAESEDNTSETDATLKDSSTIEDSSATDAADDIQDNSTDTEETGTDGN